MTNTLEGDELAASMATADTSEQETWCENLAARIVRWINKHLGGRHGN